MSLEISMFNGYSQKENRVTNYCLLMLKLLYQEKPRLLGELINQFQYIKEEEEEEECDIDISSEVLFLQQYKKEDCVFDGYILQKGFEIIIETKNFDWFYTG